MMVRAGRKRANCSEPRKMQSSHSINLSQALRTTWAVQRTRQSQPMYVTLL